MLGKGADPGSDVLTCSHLSQASFFANVADAVFSCDEEAESIKLKEKAAEDLGYSQKKLQELPPVTLRQIGPRIYSRVAELLPE